MSNANEPTKTIVVAGFASSDDLEQYKTNNFDPKVMIEFYTVPGTLLLFFIFYDIRDSISFMEKFHDGKLEALYTVSKYELPRKNESISDKNRQSSIVFLFKGMDSKIDDAFFLNFLSQHGEVKSIRESHKFEKTVEFYSSKTASDIFSSLNSTPFGSGKIECLWTWDISEKAKVSYIKNTDEFIKKFTSPANLPEKVKRPKIEENTRKHPFIALFDKFILSNLSEIERMFR